MLRVTRLVRGRPTGPAQELQTLHPSSLENTNSCLILTFRRNTGLELQLGSPKILTPALSLQEVEKQLQVEGVLTVHNREASDRHKPKVVNCHPGGV